jgi:hypothetical protein
MGTGAAMKFIRFKKYLQKYAGFYSFQKILANRPGVCYNPYKRSGFGYGEVNRAQGISEPACHVARRKNDKGRHRRPPLW